MIYLVLFFSKNPCVDPGTVGLTLGAGTVSVKIITKYQKILRVRRITVLFGSWVRDRRVREKRRRKILESAVLESLVVLLHKIESENQFY